GAPLSVSLQSDGSFQPLADPPIALAMELVARPVPLVELERDDLDGAVPSGGLEAERGAIVPSRDRLDKCVQIRCRPSVDLEDATAGPELVPSCRRTVRKVGHEHAVRSYAALSGDGTMRLL